MHLREPLWRLLALAASFISDFPRATSRAAATLQVKGKLAFTVHSTEKEGAS